MMSKITKISTFPLCRFLMGRPAEGEENVTASRQRNKRSEINQRPSKPAHLQLLRHRFQLTLVGLNIQALIHNNQEKNLEHQMHSYILHIK